MQQLLFLFHSKQPKYIQIYAHIKQLIEGKTLEANEKLPSIRALADSLYVSRNTTLQAYDLLIAEGYIRSENKRGYYVNYVEPIFLNPSLVDCSPVSIQAQPDVIDFKLGSVDQTYFPLKTWRQFSNTVLKRTESYLYGENFGEYALKKELVHYLFQARGLQIKPEQLIIGSNTQQLLLHLSFLLQENFSSILVENPGYNGVREVFELQQFHIETITATKIGLALDELPQKKSALMYITPSHHYPFGTALSIQQRWQLIQWVHERGGYLLEDDYDGEYRYGQKTFPALASLDSQRIIYFGTFSKAFLPAVRLAYMVLPEPLLSNYQQKFKQFEHNASLLHQLTMTEFMRAGEWEKHIKRMRNVYKNKMNFLVTELQKQFSHALTSIGTTAGLYIVIQVNGQLSEQELIEKALLHHVKVYATSPLFIGEPPLQPHLLIGFAHLSLQQIEEGIVRLKKAWTSDEGT